jgi:galactose mutarotase-like enzyme
MRMTGEPGGVITLSSEVLDATFVLDVGMVGVSLRHRGDEILALPGGLDGYRAGNVTGLPLLHPWANRLGARRYEAAGVTVDLEGLALHTDGGGLPIHGTMTARPGWEVVEFSEQALAVRFDFAAPELLASFPFPHELRIDLVVHAARLSVTTTLVPTGDRAVPVAFGYHPYLRLPAAAREDVRLGLPDRRHLELDDRGLPTGTSYTEPAEDEPLGTRTFDDLYALGDDRRLTLSGGGRRVAMVAGAGYRYAQVFAPPDADFVCLEPMTAPGNALVDGTYDLVPPGGSFSAHFTLEAES